MSKTNCINCGAAKDTSEIKCPFCGTTYLDLTAIDFDSEDPVVCQFILPSSIKGSDGQKLVMSMLAKPHLEQIEQSNDTVNVYAGWGTQPIASFVSERHINIGVSFAPITREDGSILTLEAKST